MLHAYKHHIPVISGHGPQFNRTLKETPRISTEHYRNYMLCLPSWVNHTQARRVVGVMFVFPCVAQFVTQANVRLLLQNFKGSHYNKVYNSMCPFELQVSPEECHIALVIRCIVPPLQ
eukprot:Blabericola_migrator_1__1072@NODE_1273_length_4923_cov_16_538715_g858_i0_p3_GENE_NODE_1273_length_4923_cov_16_538715_g858_i0NODE_1273_length_4923_cov_16_538715_g858_i0_p3_ORF_typecomplete_len118_score3_60COX6B/PF02297_17/6_1COX6B/PF02297_17/51_NODE_1273_length_4923_cov_16_538715_g858_i021512504